MVRLRSFRLPIPSYKLFRLLLPLAVFIAGITIFLCGLVRTYHVSEKITKAEHEKSLVRTQNDYVEWWIGFVLAVTAVLACLAVLFDKPLLFKMSVLASGFCFIMTIFGVFWDAGEFSEIARDKRMLQFLTSQGHTCETALHNFTYSGVQYTFRDCECKKGTVVNFNFFVPYSCEVLDALYYLHSVLAFAMSCAIGFTLFTLFSFVLILKRISQITTALHLDEKPLSEDFNISGDLYIDS